MIILLFIWLIIIFCFFILFKWLENLLCFFCFFFLDEDFIDYFFMWVFLILVFFELDNLLDFFGLIIFKEDFKDYFLFCNFLDVSFFSCDRLFVSFFLVLFWFLIIVEFNLMLFVDFVFLFVCFSEKESWCLMVKLVLVVCIEDLIGILFKWNFGLVLILCGFFLNLLFLECEFLFLGFLEI